MPLPSSLLNRLRRSLSGAPAAVRTADPGPPTINELYHARRLSLVRLAVLMVDARPTAEDIVQDAFTALFRRHGADLRVVSEVVLTRLPGPDAVAPTGPAVTAPAPSPATSAAGPAPSSAAAGPVPTASAGVERPTTVPSATGERVLVPAH